MSTMRAGRARSAAGREPLPRPAIEAKTRAPRRPNLLFILTDQQRRDTLGAYGNSVIRTPNLDALARSSVVFERCYVTQPVCTPSRASIMTGLYPHSHGSWHNDIPLDRAVPILPE